MKWCSMCRYSLRYIDVCMKDFFWKYLHLSSRRLVAVIDDENEYVSIRSKLLEQPSGAEQQVLSRIATIARQDQDRIDTNVDCDQHRSVHQSNSLNRRAT